MYNKDMTFKKKRSFIGLILVCCLVLVSALPVLAQAGLKFQQVSIGEGLSQSTVNCIYQDREGFIWFGTRDGLNRYDGKKMTVYSYVPGKTNTLSNYSVSCIREDGNGNLWIGTEGGGLDKLDPATGVITTYKHEPGRPGGLPHNIVQSITAGRNGRLWIVTLGTGISVFDPRDTGKPGTPKFNNYRFIKGKTGGLSSNSVTEICTDVSGIVWAATYGKGLNRFDPATGTFTYYTYKKENKDSIGSNYISTICPDRSGLLWLGLWGRGIGSFNPGTGKFKSYPYPFDTTKEPGVFRVTTICEDKEGWLWIGTSGAGLIIFNRETGTFTRYRDEPGNRFGLKSNHILSIREDASGVVWVGTLDAGVFTWSRYREKFAHLRLYGTKGELVKSDVRAIYEDSRKNLWIGTKTRGLYRYNSKIGEGKTGEFTRHGADPSNRMSGSRVSSITEVPDGTLWIGIEGGGLNKLDLETLRFTHYIHDPANAGSLCNDVVLALEKGGPDTLWIGTAEGLSRYDNRTGDFTAFRHEPGNQSSLSRDNVHVIFRDKAGAAWVGTYLGGLNRFNGEDRGKALFTRFVFDPANPASLSDNSILSIGETGDGALWVGTAVGLNKMNKKKGTFTRYTMAHGLPNHRVKGILADHWGSLWLTTNKGISRFNPATGECKNYGPESGVQGYEFNGGAYYKTAAGEIYFGGLNGLNVFHPDRLPMNRHVPPVVFTGFKLFNRTVPVGEDSPLKKHIGACEEIVLAYDQNICSFEVAALDYTAPAKNRYKYKVEGLTEDWISLENERNIGFTGLEPGTYMLRVKGSNNDGTWNEKGKTITIIIRPPFWATWWFRILLVILLGATAILWHQSRMKRLELRLQSETEMERIFRKFNISKREQEVIELILKGKTNKDIEEELFISLQTVKSHIYRIYKKMGVQNRLELINMVQKSVVK